MTDDWDRLPPVQAFGTWDAPATDDAVWIDVPTHLQCIWCGEAFQDSDNGAIQPMGHAEHRECAFRNVMGGIGHHVNHARYCHTDLGPDAGLPKRTSALLVWRHLVERDPVDEPQLQWLRQRYHESP